MASTTFIMTNVPNDKELVINFVEGILDSTTTHVEYSVNSDTSVLVTIKDNLDLDDVKDTLMSESKDIIKDENEPLGILDPGYVTGAVVVKNVDEEFLSHEMLRLYIESTFADGNAVVDDCKAIQYGENTVVVSFNERASDVISRVLEEEDHVPLSSVQDYHIHFKQFYNNFYTSEMEWERVSQSDTDSLSLYDHQDSDNNMSSVWEEPSTDDTDHSKKGKRFFSLNYIDNLASEDKKEDEEKMTISKLNWKLLKEKITAVTNCQVDYKEDEETLYIRGTDVTNSHSEIISLVRSVKRSSINLSKDMKTLLEKDKVKRMMRQSFPDQKDRVFEIGNDSLNISSVGNGEDIAETVRSRIFDTKSIQLQKHLSKSQINECVTHCKRSDLLAVLSYDDDESQFTITGIKEDVSMLFNEIDTKLKDWEKIEATCKFTGRDAKFIHNYAMEQLKKIFEKADISKEVNQNDEVFFEYKIQRAHKKVHDKALDKFRKCIVTTDVDLKEFSQEDLALISQNLKTDVEFLNNFQDGNTCCIFVEGVESENFLGARVRGTTHTASPQLKTSKAAIATLSDKQKEVYTICSSCQLQISQDKDITKEKSDLLVCVVDDSLNLSKTMVSKAFSKLDSNLQSQIKTFTFSQNGVFIDQRSIPGTHCKAIAFITFKVWQKGVSDQRLDAAVTEILDQANKMGLSSISIPPLGYGKAFKYPANETAQTVLSAIHSFINANTGGLHIKWINLLAPEKVLFNEIFKGANSIQTLTRVDNSDDDDDDDSDDDDDGNEEEKENEMEVLKPTKPLHISIVAAGKGQLVSKFKDEIKKQWLHKTHVAPGDKFCWSPQFMNGVIKEARGLGIWVFKIKDASSKQFICQIKGKKDNVLEMKAKIAQMMLELNNDEPKKVLFSSSAPKRSTLEFVKYAAQCEARFPSYWTLKWSDYVKGAVTQLQLFDVDQPTFKLIEKVVKNTWDSAKVGLGNDAAGIPRNSQVEVKKVERVENPSLYVKYAVKRGFICKDICQRNRLCVNVGQITNSKGPAETMMHLDKPLAKELLTEINEYFLLHGTKQDIVDAICQQGMDSRLASTGGMFGQGVYTAESSTKADQYADARDSRLRNGSTLTMFLTRVTMGDIFLCDDNHESVQTRNSMKLKRPPCMKCEKDICNCGTHFYHSVMGDGKWIYREFVVYEKDQCYPEYKITYQRV